MLTQPRQTAGKGRSPRGHFLPDFCALPLLFAVVVLAEFLALILTLAQPGGDFWSTLALTSLFVQWIGLGSTALLCAARPLFKRLHDTAAAIASYLLLLSVLLLVIEVSYWLLPLQGDHQEFLLRNLAIGAIIMALALRYFYVHHQWRLRIEAEGEARIQALQARIRPHFLFNSMNTIASLIRTRPEVAEEAVEDLADLFRASLAEHRRLVPLEEELFLTRRYLHMEQLRLGERLQLQWQVEGVDTHLPIPPLTLQPLVENAVYHGIETLPEGGTIVIRAEPAPDGVRITIENPCGTGRGDHPPGHQIAMENIRLRLAAHFGDAASLAYQQLGDRYRLTLTLPHPGGRP